MRGFIWIRIGIMLTFVTVREVCSLVLQYAEVTQNIVSVAQWALTGSVTA